MLISFANITYLNGAHPSPYAANATMIRYKEVTHKNPADVVFDLELFDRTNTSTTYSGCLGYRSDRIPDLYSVQPARVEDLIAAYEDGKMRLTFSADPTHDHRVEASDDLSLWMEIGMPTDETGRGDYVYEDEQTQDYTVRFYRVVSSHGDL